MLELGPCELELVGCHGAAAALDRLTVEGALRFRVAPDELLLIASPGAGSAVLAEAERQLAEHDPDAFALLRTDAYSAYTFGGDGAEEAFRRLCAVPLPDERPACVQGLVAGVPAKIVALRDRLHVLVPSTVGHHLRGRAADVTVDLAPVVGAAVPVDLSGAVGR